MERTITRHKALEILSEVHKTACKNSKREDLEAYERAVFRAFDSDTDEITFDTMFSRVGKLLLCDAQ